MKKQLSKLLSAVLALTVLLSCVMVGTLASADSEVEQAVASIKAAVQAYVDTAGNGATKEGVEAAAQAILPAATVSDFAISHMLPGAVDTDTNADTQFRMDGKAGAVVVTIAVGDVSASGVFTIPYVKETITISGVATAGVSDGFTYDGSGNITNYSGTADKLVIPAGYTGTVTGAANFTKQFKVVVIANGSTIPAEAFKSSTELVAVDLKSAVLNAATNQFRSCSNLKYAKLYKFGRLNGDNGGTLIGQQAFQDCTSLQNVSIFSNAHGWGSGMLDWNCFANTTSLPVLYWDNVNGSTIYKHQNGIGFAGAEYNYGTTVTSVLLAAELQAMAGAVEYTEGMTGDQVLAAIKASPWLAVYDSKPAYTLAWKDGFDAYGFDGTIGGELILTVGEETFPLTFEREVEGVIESIKETAQTYVDIAGNKATQAGLLAALPAGATVDSFAISHMLPGAVDTDPNADTQFRIEGKAGAVVAVVDIGGEKITTVSTIPYVKETITISGVATAGVSDGFTYDGSGNITNYSGTADKLVIPAGYTGTVTGAANFTKQFKVVVIANGSTIPAEAFKSSTELVAVDLKSAVLNAATNQFRSCSNLKYAKLYKFARVSDSNRTMIGQQAFQDCTSLQNVSVFFSANGYGLSMLDYNCFANTTSLPVLYWDNANGSTIYEHDSGIGFTGAKYNYGTTVTSVLLAAELQAMAGAVEYTEGMTGDQVLAAIKASPWLAVYDSKPAYTLAWKDGFDAVGADGTIGGELILTVGEETFDLSYEHVLFETYEITAGENVSVSKDVAAAGDRITVTVNAPDGKVLKAGGLTYTVNGRTYPLYKREGSFVYDGAAENDEVNDSVFFFAMPEADVTINAEFVDDDAKNLVAFGVSIRDPNPAEDVSSGLQFGSRVYLTMGDYTLKNFGTLVWSEFATPYDPANDLDAWKAANAGKFVMKQCTQLMDRCDSYVDYSLRLFNAIENDKADVVYTAMAYAVYSNGAETVTVFSAPRSNSYDQIAGYTSVPNLTYENPDKPSSYKVAYKQSPVQSTVVAEATEMRKSVLNAESVKSPAELSAEGYTVYYISNSGSDSNDGKSPEKAFATPDPLFNRTALEELLDPLPDKIAVLFERGGVYRGVQIEAKSNMFIGAYGEGDKPCLYAPKENSAKANWTSQGNNVWRLDTKQTSGDVGTVVFNHGEQYASRKLSMADLQQDLDFYFDVDSQYLYLRCSQNPCDAFVDIEVTPKAYVIGIYEGTSNVTIDNLTLKYAGHGAVGCEGDVRGTTITNCEIAWIGGILYEGGPTRFGNGIQWWNGCQDALVQNCWIYQVYDSGISPQGNAEHVEKNITIKENLIEYCGYASFEYWVHPAPQASIEDMFVTDNIMRFAGCGFGTDGRDDQAPHIRSNGGLDNLYSGSFEISGNIFEGIGKGNLFYCESLQNTLPVFEGNRYIQVLGGNFGFYGSDAVKVQNIASIQMYLTEVLGDTTAKFEIYPY